MPKTAITTPFGLFEFLGMPPGLRNAAQMFQRHMNNILRELDFVVAFQDDLLIFSNTEEQHLRHLTAVLDILRANKLTINPSKCQFCRPEIIFLEFNISREGFRPPESRAHAIAEFLKPDTISDLCRFLGVVNYYRCNIPHATETQAPLNALLKDVRKNDKRKVP